MSVVADLFIRHRAVLSEVDVKQLSVEARAAFGKDAFLRSEGSVGLPAHDELSICWSVGNYRRWLKSIGAQWENEEPGVVAADPVGPSLLPD